MIEHTHETPVEVLLEDASTEEIHAELARRNDAVVTLCYRILDAKRQETYREFHGGCTMLLGMLRTAQMEVETSFEMRKPNRGSDDSMDNDCD